MIIRCIDFETTALDPGTAKICEVGWCDLEFHPSDSEFEPVVGLPQGELTDPGVSIPPEASGIHHITDDMVTGKRKPEWVLRELLDGADYIGAHNIAYESALLATSLPWVCSYKCAHREWPFAPDHKLQTLRYWLGLTAPAHAAMPPHRAAPDAYVSALVIQRLLAVRPVDFLARISAGPALLVKVGFGKHRGKFWFDLPRIDPGYLDWLVNKSDFDDRDVLATARYYLRGNKPPYEIPATATAGEQDDKIPF